MRKIHLIIGLILFSLIGFNCQKEIGSGNANPVNNNLNPITATVQGNILDENGQPANNVSIKVGSKTTTTNARGYFRIENAPLDKKTSLVTAEKSGYFKAYRVFGATSATNQVTIQLLKKTLAGTINTSSGGSVSLTNGSKIELPVNGVVKKSGGSYSGTVNVYANYIDPTGSTIRQTVPGSFLATDKNNNPALLASYGMLAVELESTAGEKLQIATGQTATLTTAIPSSLQSSAPATIQLWYVDEQTGIWKEEGTATKNGNNYVGQVKHFTYWNCDVPGPTINLTATFKDPAGNPLSFEWITIRPATGYGAAHGQTDSQGQLNQRPVPANIPLVLEVTSPCGGVAYSQNIGPYTSAVDIGTITADLSSFALTVQGKLTDCSGVAVTNGYAMISFNNIVRYANVNASGNFSCAMMTCVGMPPTCEIIGFDETTHQQGAAVNVTVATPITNAGVLSACGNSSLQYINYNIDGVNQSISSLVPTDQFYVNSYDTLTLTHTYIGGVKSSIVQIAFQFVNNKMPGTFPIDNLYLVNFLNLAVVQPFNIVVTHFPLTVGDYYEGSFSGQFTDSGGNTHTISCSFRVRRT